MSNIRFNGFDPFQFTDTLITSPKQYHRLKTAAISTLEKDMLSDIEVIADNYCEEDIGYLFDNTGEITRIVYKD
jgi:hypothetical protein